jgi:hypothetical protein
MIGVISDSHDNVMMLRKGVVPLKDAGHKLVVGSPNLMP